MKFKGENFQNIDLRRLNYHLLYEFLTDILFNKIKISWYIFFKFESNGGVLYLSSLGNITVLQQLYQIGCYAKTLATNLSLYFTEQELWRIPIFAVWKILQTLCISVTFEIFFFSFFFLWFGLAKIFSCFFNFAYKQVLIQAIIFYSYSDTNKNFHFLIKNDVPPLIIQTIKTFFEEKRKIHSFIHSFIHLSAFIKCIQLTLMDQHLNLIHPILISKKKICLNVLKQGYQKT